MPVPVFITRADQVKINEYRSDHVARSMQDRDHGNASLHASNCG
ncbi:hypothetical protein RSSM_05872 [Rhodopirellula sallentina SM41]|uniref:Uncharacterized protein n=1 Tax=Rhodopirellula sallentina SM41 TaxID=1263870 RepID=M5U9N2_9BACT|nr:hypothetical protein RSSM_05872 [Rhodopirellula sallentina SM41]